MYVESNYTVDCTYNVDHAGISTYTYARALVISKPSSYQVHVLEHNNHCVKGTHCMWIAGTLK